MNKITVTAATIAASVFLATAPVLAESPGQLQGGSLTFKVKNVTQNGAYANSISASNCDEVKYSINLHNTEFGALHNVTAKVTLGNTSNLVATTDAGGTTGTSGTAVVNSAQGLTYVKGSTKLYDRSGNLIKNLPDGITGNGVNVGTLNGSTTEFVNFEAKVNCPVTVAEQPQPQPLPQTGPEVGLAAAAGTGAMGYAVVAYRRGRRALADKLINRK